VGFRIFRWIFGSCKRRAKVREGNKKKMSAPERMSGMDTELAVCLGVLWLSTTGSLLAFLPMWFSNQSEAFHPHSVAVDRRHSLFLVVNSETVCKWDCCVASISAFVAPRGSSSSKYFTVLVIATCISGFLGAIRWHMMGDAKELEAGFACLGFASLLLVAGFELDVLPQSFLEAKLMVTGWLLEKLGADKDLPFRLSAHRFVCLFVCLFGCCCCCCCCWCCVCKCVVSVLCVV